MRLLLALSVALIAVIHVLGLQFGWYLTIRWMDIPMHIAGGAWVALLFVYIARDRLGAFSSGAKWELIVAGLGTVAIVGIGWEIFELLMDVYVWRQYGFFNAPGPVHFDTLTDLVNDLIGAVLTLWVLSRRNNPRRS